MEEEGEHADGDESVAEAGGGEPVTCEKIRVREKQKWNVRGRPSQNDGKRG